MASTAPGLPEHRNPAEIPSRRLPRLRTGRRHGWLAVAVRPRDRVPAAAVPDSLQAPLQGRSAASGRGALTSAHRCRQLRRPPHRRSRPPDRRGRPRSPNGCAGAVTRSSPTCCGAVPTWRCPPRPTWRCSPAGSACAPPCSVRSTAWTPSRCGSSKHWCCPPVGDVASVADAGALLGDEISADDLSRGIEELLELGLVWGDADDPHLVSSVADAVGPHPAGLGRPAQTLLRHVSDLQLAPVLRSLGLPPAAQPRAGAAVAEVLGSPQRVAELIAAERRRRSARSSTGSPPGRPTAQFATRSCPRPGRTCRRRTG